MLTTSTKRGRLHQAHDDNGNALDWDSEAGTFNGDVAFKVDSKGNLIYEEATITIFESSIEMFAGKENKDKEMVVTDAHENEHDLNTEDIKSIKDRGEGKKNIRNVEIDAYKIGNKVREEIKENE